ncbi:hypothetical protein QJS10_CPA05g01062 [Acorus calamus]|uniref:Reverse transcriptase zinc-binding domain-containing protein n=1 Tax=Acorus calamus TaxID=4465 RepID=A0AAV9EV43_ACOCL|nr:hypothetical protein QJS10_CPA05g01062 [Acorus calamus]
MGSGEWRLNFRRISNDLQVQECADLLRDLEGQAISVDRPDELLWGPNPTEGYSVKKGYEWWSRNIRSNREMAIHTPRLWKWKVPGKIKIFMWLVLQNRLLTKSYRAKWRPFEPTDCPMCNVEPETVEHLLIRCTMAARLWSEISRSTGMGLQLQGMTELRDTVQNPIPSPHHLPVKFTRILIPAGLWAIWRTRNGVLFRGQRLYFENLWDTALQLIRDWGKHLAHNGRESSWGSHHPRVSAMAAQQGHRLCTCGVQSDIHGVSFPIWVLRQSM